MKNTFVAAAGMLGGLITVIMFNNCSDQAQNFERNIASDVAAIASTSAGPPVSGSSSPVANALNLTKAKFFVASSLAGPWVENGKACRGQNSFFKTTGVDFSQQIKGCAVQTSSSDCLNLNAHRAFQASEVVNGEIITSISAQDSYAWPLGSYSFFLSARADADTVTLKRVGNSSFENCSQIGDPPVGPIVCAWREVNIQPVIGGGNTVYPATPCTQATVGQIGSGYYDMGSGNTIPKTYECTCS